MRPNIRLTLRRNALGDLAAPARSGVALWTTPINQCLLTFYCEETP